MVILLQPSSFIIQVSVIVYAVSQESSLFISCLFQMKMEGSEVRRVHVIYFLCRNGCVEHPHLIRVHHQTRNNGVKLRDVKRWLGELRGEDMPESYSWSYKRRYKTGYVWQDLVDDDLINPISDNEYILKGSQLVSYTKNARIPKDHQTNSGNSTKAASSNIQEESPPVGLEVSTMTDGSANAGKNDENSWTTMKTKHYENVTAASSAAANSTRGNKSRPNGSLSMFRNLISCSAVDANSSAVVRLKELQIHSQPLLNMCNSSDVRNLRSADELFKGDNLRGSQRVFGNPHWMQQHCNGRKSYSFDGGKDKRVPRSTQYPVNRPICSQCGKTFKPEKMHSHMKSCKGMKALLSKASKGSVE